MGAAEQRMADWIALLDDPPTEEEKRAYVARAKAHPTARVGGGWVLIGPLDDRYEPDMPWKQYEFLREDGTWAETLTIDMAVPHGEAEREVLRWALAVKQRYESRQEARS